MRALLRHVHAGGAARGGNGNLTAAFTVEEHVRWGDVDIAGVVCYGAYVRFFDLAESELFRAAGIPYGEVFERFNVWLPRVKLICEFRAPAKLDERLRVSASVKRMGTKSVTLAFAVENAAGVRIADCEIVLVCVERATFKSAPLPPALRDALTPYLS